MFKYVDMIIKKQKLSRIRQKLEGDIAFFIEEISLYSSNGVIDMKDSKELRQFLFDTLELPILRQISEDIASLSVGHLKELLLVPSMSEKKKMVIRLIISCRKRQKQLSIINNMIRRGSNYLEDYIYKSNQIDKLII